MAVLGVALIVCICALAGMHLARLELKGAVGGNDLQRAQLLATSAIEHAVGIMNSSSQGNGQWRSSYTSGQETSAVQLGGGTFSFKLVDDDGNLADDAIDPVWVYGIGRAGQAVWVERARARTDRGLPLEALNTCLHSRSQIKVDDDATLTVSGAPASTDGHVNIAGTIVGDAQAVTKTGTGTITGTTTVPATRKGVPWSTIYSNYMARATQLTYTGNLDTVVLAPGVNEYGGGLNADGVYYINTAGNHLRIRRVRLCGTLIINAGTKRVTIDRNCFLEPFRDDFPVLIIKGETTLGLSSTGSYEYLSESTEGHNFNPAGAAYQGTADTDTVDSYPSEIRGLVHVIGNVTFSGSGVYRGAVVVQGGVTVASGTPRIVQDSNLILNPPWGYSSDPNSSSMIVQLQTWTRQPAP